MRYIELSEREATVNILALDEKKTLLETMVRQGDASQETAQEIRDIDRIKDAIEEGARS